MATRLKYASMALALALIAGYFPQSATAQSQGYRADTSRPAAPVLPFERLERLASSEIAHVTELEVRDLILKAKGYDAEGMKVEVLMDRRDGSVLSRRVKYPKHMQRYYPAGTPAAPGSYR